MCPLLLTPSLIHPEHQRCTLLPWPCIEAPRSSHGPHHQQGQPHQPSILSKAIVYSLLFLPALFSLVLPVCTSCSVEKHFAIRNYDGFPIVYISLRYMRTQLAKWYTCIFYSIRILDYSATRVLWIAQNAGGSFADYQEVGSSPFELEHTNIGTYKLFVLLLSLRSFSRAHSFLPRYPALHLSHSA